MKAVVDTTVIAGYVLRAEPHFAAAQGFWRRVSEPVAPSLWQAELTNVAWKCVCHGALAIDDALESLRFAAQLGIRTVSVATLWEAALARAVTHKHPAYDVLCVQLALREGVKLVTMDKKLLGLFSEVAIPP